MKSHTTETPMSVFTMTDAAARLTISRSRAYELVASGELESFRIGRLRRVTAQAIDSFIQEAHDD